MKVVEIREILVLS